MNPSDIKDLRLRSRLMDADAEQNGLKHHENNPRITGIPDAKPSKQTGTLDGDNARKASGAGRAHVRFILCRQRLLDVDAKFGSIKDLLDGLVYSELIRGDREDQITLEVEQRKVKRCEEKTVIEVTL